MKGQTNFEFSLRNHKNYIYSPRNRNKYLKIVCKILFCFILIFIVLSMISSAYGYLSYDTKGTEPQNKTINNLVEFVRNNYIFGSNSFSPAQQDLQDVNILKDSLVQHLIADGLINSDIPGYFVDLGAHNGMGWTNTIILQLKDWKGLLIEPFPEVFNKLLENVSGSNVTLSNATISTTRDSKTEMFYYNSKVDLWGGLTYRFYKGTSSSKSVLTVPLEIVLKAANSPRTIDLLIIDIEGAEMDVIKTLDFDQFLYKTIVVEVNNGNEGSGAISKYLFGKGYKLVKNVIVPLNKHLAKKISKIINMQDVHSQYIIFKL